MAAEQSEENSIKYVYPSRHFGRFIIEASGCQTPTQHAAGTHEPSHAVRFLSANKSSCLCNDGPNKNSYISVKIGTNLIQVWILLLKPIYKVEKVIQILSPSGKLPVSLSCGALSPMPA